MNLFLKRVFATIVPILSYTYTNYKMIYLRPLEKSQERGIVLQPSTHTDSCGGEFFAKLWNRWLRTRTFPAVTLKRFKVYTESDLTQTIEVLLLLGGQKLINYQKHDHYRAQSNKVESKLAAKAKLYRLRMLISISLSNFKRLVSDDTLIRKLLGHCIRPLQFL